jgi:hypothetical protein
MTAEVQWRSGGIYIIEKLMARKRKGFRRIIGGTTQTVKEDNPRKNQQPDGPSRREDNKGLLDRI